MKLRMSVVAGLIAEETRRMRPLETQRLCADLYVIQDGFANVFLVNLPAMASSPSMPESTPEYRAGDENPWDRAFGREGGLDHALRTSITFMDSGPFRG